VQGKREARSCELVLLKEVLIHLPLRDAKNLIDQVPSFRFSRFCAYREMPPFLGLGFGVWGLGFGVWLHLLRGGCLSHACLCPCPMASSRLLRPAYRPLFFVARVSASTSNFAHVQVQALSRAALDASLLERPRYLLVLAPNPYTLHP
jgi:hypothetical protein